MELTWEIAKYFTRNCKILENLKISLYTENILVPFRNYPMTLGTFDPKIPWRIRDILEVKHTDDSLASDARIKISLTSVNIALKEEETGRYFYSVHTLKIHEVQILCTLEQIIQ